MLNPQPYSEAMMLNPSHFDFSHERDTKQQKERTLAPTLIVTLTLIAAVHPPFQPQPRCSSTTSSFHNAAVHTAPLMSPSYDKTPSPNSDPNPNPNLSTVPFVHAFQPLRSRCLLSYILEGLW